MFIVFGANLLGGPQVAQQQGSEAHAPNGQRNTDAKPIPPLRVVIEEPIPTIRTQPVTSPQQDQPPEKPWQKFTRPEWVIVYVTAVYVLIAWWTLSAIKRQAKFLKEQVDDARRTNSENAETAARTLRLIEAQAKLMEDSVTVAKIQVQATELGVQVAMRSAEATLLAAGAGRDNANAALLSAKAVLASERPWFVTSVVQDDDNPILWKIRIMNRGRTPGHMNVMFSEHIFVNNADNLPIPPRYESGCYIPDTRFLATGDSFTDRERIPGFNPDFAMEHERKNQIDLLVIYGRVTYSDTFTWGTPEEIIHETRWCYLYLSDPSGFVPFGPYAYNGYRDWPKGEKAT
jgi:hypothetical protein